MSDRTTVHLMRHGEVHNPDKILYGRLPGYVLSERGHAMAALTADYLSGRDVVKIVSSPLERAQQTAAPLGKEFGLDVALDERVLEAENSFEGKTFGSGAGSPANPRNWKLFVNPFLPSWGEPYEKIATRMLAAVEDVRREAAGHECVIVSHQLPVWTTRCKLEGRRLWHDPRSRQCTLASLTSLTFEGDRLLAVTYAEPAASLLPGASSVPGA